MNRNGPLLTLLAGGALAAVLLAASINAATAGDDPPAEAAPAGAAAPDTTPTPTPTAEPEPEPAEPITYVGWNDDEDASVAIIIDDDQATAYVCDGATVEVWLTGTARNGELLLNADTGDALVGSYDDEQAQGRTNAEGQDWTFTIEKVAAPEGLYRFADTIPGGAEVDGGWIVLPDGTQVGLLTVDGRTTPAPALNPTTGHVDLDGHTTITAERIGG